MSAILKIKTLVEQNFRNLYLYGIIGSISAGLDFLVYYLLTTELEVSYQFANVLSVLIGITTSFILNRRFNFKVTDKVLRRFIIFLSVGLGGLLLSSLYLHVFVEILLFNQLVSKLLSIAFVVLMQFVLNKFITFKIYFDE